ncbi:MAG: beta strand repeat-containing protein [Limisphaerales bacterium]
MKSLPHASRTRSFVALLTVLFLLVLTAAPASAADVTWTGGGTPDGNWQTAANWGGTVPVARDALFFGGTTQPASTNNFAAGTVFGGLTFSSGAGAFTLAGNGLVLTNAGQDPTTSALSGGNIASHSASAQTINLPLTLSAGYHTITNAAGAGALNVAGTVTRNAGSTVQFIKGGGNLNFTGSGLANANGILGGWAGIGLGLHVGDWAVLDGGGNVVAYSGYTTKAGNTSWALSNTGADAAKNIKINTSRGTATLNGATAGTYDVNSILWNQGANPGGQEILTLSSGQVLRLGANGGIMSVHANWIFNVGNNGGGTITAGGADNTPGELTLALAPLDDTNQRLNINAPITDNGTGVVRVNTIGWVLMLRNSTYSGGTHITRGRVQASSVASGVNTGFGTGPVYVYPGAQAFVFESGQTDVVVTNDFYIAGFGTAEDKGGALRLSVNNPSPVNYTGTITLMGDTSLGRNGWFSGRITGNGKLLIGDSGLNGTVIFSNAVPHDYTGDTIINNPNATGANTLRIGSASLNNILPHGPGKGNIILNNNGSGSWPTLVLNGSTQTINGLTTSGVNQSNAWVQAGSGTATLVVGDNNASSTYAGILRDQGGTLALTKIGSGTLTLAALAGQAPNAYSGVTTISNGTLALSGSATIPNTPVINVVSGATFDVSATTFTLRSNQTLLGNGTVNGAVAVEGTVAPGASIGTLNFGSLVTFNSTAVADVELGDGPTGDKMAATGAVTYGGTLKLTWTGTTPAAGTVDLFDGSGFSGGFTALQLVNWPSSLRVTTNNLSVNGSITLAANNAPVAQPLTLGVARGQTASLTVIGGKKAPTDADGDSLKVAAVSGAIIGGGVAATNGGTGFTYTADATSVLGTNTFTYTVTDAFGATDTKTVTVIVYEPQGFNRVSGPTPVGGGQYEINYLGMPGEKYAIDETDDLTPPITWTPIVTNTAGGNGAINFTVTPGFYPSGYFRTRHVP